MQQIFSGSSQRTALQVGVILGRVFIGALFIVSGLVKVGNIDAVASSLAARGLPFEQVASYLAVLMEVGGGLGLAAGWRVRRVAFLLALFVVPATFLYHAFWQSDAAAFGNQLNHFLKNVGIIGALLMIACAGPTVSDEQVTNQAGSARA